MVVLLGISRMASLSRRSYGIIVLLFLMQNEQPLFCRRCPFSLFATCLLSPRCVSRGLLEEQGDIEGAKAAYGQAIAGGHAWAASEAATYLRRLERFPLPPRK